MKIETIWAMYFSPVSTTGQLVEAMAKKASKKLGNVSVKVYDWTLPEARRQVPSLGEKDFVFLGTPTYAGRVPNKLMPFIRDGLKGNGARGAAVVTYGNRSYDDALIELYDLMKRNHFQMTGAAAFVCQHVFSDQLASGRPDKKDRKQAEEFAVKAVSGEPGPELDKKIPGNRPVGPYYVPKGEDGSPVRFLTAKPVTSEEFCDRCGKCASVCPMGCISKEDVTKTTGICIKCQACIHKCPKGAKFFDDPAFLSHKKMLEQHYAKQKLKNEIYVL